MIPLLLTLAQIVFFTPPKDWMIIEPKKQPKEITIGFIEPAINYPSSMNMVTEKTTVSLKEYVKAVKNLYQGKRNQTLRDLGSLPLKKGCAHLLEIDTETSHGIFRQLQLLYAHQGEIIILTSASKDHKFLKAKDDILKALKSLTIAGDIFETVTQEEKIKIESKFRELSHSGLNEKEFLEKYAFFLHNEFSDKGPFWELLMLKKLSQVEQP
jgi:hypothetical protein